MRVVSLSMAAWLFAAAGSAQPAPDGHVVSWPAGVLVTGHVLPTDAASRVAEGDIGAQTRLALSNLDALLKRHGSSLARAASIHVALRRAADFQAMNAAYAPMFTADPPVRTTIVAAPADAAALVQVSAVALANGVERRVVHPQGWAKSLNPYSYGIKSGDTLWLAGLVARRGADNASVEGDIAVQTGVVFDNAEAILTAAGMTLADVVSSRVFVTDAAAFQAMNTAYRARMPEPRPVRATVVCGLMNPAFVVEMTFVAVRGDKRAFTTPRPDGSPGTPGPNFSSAIRVGNRLWVSGFMGSDDTNRGDVRGQTRQILASIERTLNASGSSWAEVADAVVYVTAAAQREPVEQMMREAIGRVPATTVLETGLVAPDGLVEIMVSARTPPK
jgi:enamine deaminase RidA (YjgF/YER057c/UK114 family)